MKGLGEFRVIDGQRYEMTIPEDGDPAPSFVPPSTPEFDRAVTRLISLGYLTRVEGH